MSRLGESHAIVLLDELHPKVFSALPGTLEHAPCAKMSIMNSLPSLVKPSLKGRLAAAAAHVIMACGATLQFRALAYCLSLPRALQERAPLL